MSEDFMDKFLTENFPVVPVPQSGRVDMPGKFGQRFLLGKRALFREVVTPWLYAALPIASIKGLESPYGDFKPEVRFTMEPPPADLWREFLKEARSALPNECAALMAWNSQTGEWRLAMRVATHATQARVDYTEPVLQESEIAVIDVHSHGDHSAFFSSRDNRDDLGGIKIAAVFGLVDSCSSPELQLRLVCLDKFLELRLEQAGDRPPIQVLGDLR